MLQRQFTPRLKHQHEEPNFYEHFPNTIFNPHSAVSSILMACSFAASLKIS